MKKSILLCLFVFCGLSLAAQLKISKVTISQNFENDMLKGMDFDYFNELLPSGNALNFSAENFQKEQTNSMQCDNSGVTLEITMTDPALELLELRFGMHYIDNKIDALTYNNVMEDYAGDYVTFNSTFSEIGVHTALVRRFPWKFFNGYVGAGVNISKSLRNELCVFGSDDLTAADIHWHNTAEVRAEVMDESYGFASDCYVVDNHLGGHVYFILGGSFIIAKRVELGLEMYAGPGFRAHALSNMNGTNLGGINMRASVLF